MPESFNKLVNFSTFLYCEYLKVRGVLFATVNPFIILIIIIVIMIIIFFLKNIKPAPFKRINTNKKM